MSELHLVIGGAGCIGSELVKALLARGESVRVLDNLSSGRQEHLNEFRGNVNFTCMIGDAYNALTVRDAMRGVDTVWHLVAKTDIKFTANYDFDADVVENFDTTWNILREAKECKVAEIVFASSAAVYGERSILDEDMVPEPVSMYGATKLASEAIIRAFALRTGMRAWMFRFCSIVSGKARTSGNMVIPDLLHKLRKDPTRLEILGDGNQTKPSLLVSECVEAMLFAFDHARDQVNLFNLGVDDDISVTRQAELIVEALGLQNVQFAYMGGKGGWPGDVPSFRMHVQKLANLGWRARRTSEQAVKEAIHGLIESGE